MDAPFPLDHLPTRGRAPRSSLHPKGLVDCRAKNARRLRDIARSFATETLGRDLPDIAEPDRALVRSLAALAVRSEAMQVALSRGEAVDPDLLIRLSSELRAGLAELRERGADK